MGGRPVLVADWRRGEGEGGQKLMGMWTGRETFITCVLTRKKQQNKLTLDLMKKRRNTHAETL